MVSIFILIHVQNSGFINKMQRESSTKDITGALKGIAIVIVIVNHYINIYLSKSFVGYANGVISLFFIFSGYSMYLVFEKYADLSISSVTVFWVQRFMRIYPLFWVSMFAVQVLGLNNTQYWMDYIVPNYRVLIPYWFINALIQCYLVAPLVYMVQKKIGSAGLIVTLIGFVLLANISPLTTHFTNEHIFLRYKFLLLIHLLFFCTGLALPMIIKANPKGLESNWVLLLSLIAFWVMVFLTRKKGMFFFASELFFVPLFYLSAFWFCFIILKRNPSFVSKDFFSNIGILSYSLYLFHLAYFALVNKLIDFTNFPGWHLVLTVVLSPLFYLVCMYLERTSRKLALIIDNRFLKGSMFVVKKTLQGSDSNW